MDDSDKVLELRRSTEARDEDSVLLSYLAQAREIILSRMYPYREENGLAEPEVPRRFEWKQIRIAAYLLNKRGAEGETDREDVLMLRRGQIRNFLTLLFLSQGTLLINAGDECLNTQGGNNNPYCQDNETGWTDWPDTRESAELTEFVR